MSRLSKRRWRRLSSVLLSSLLSWPSLAAQPSPSSDRGVLLSGADLYTVSHGVIEGGELLIRDGRIAALGARVEAPADAERIDVSGKRVYPGLISSISMLGLVEFMRVEASQDLAEAGENNADLHVEIAVEPDTEQWPVARSGGLLSALIVPQVRSGGLFAGQSALMKPQGWTGEQMTVRSSVGLHLYWPTSPQLRRRLDELMEAARLYHATRPARTAAPDLRLAALGPMLEGKQPLYIHADRIRQVHEALAFARQERVRVVLVSGPEAARAAGEIAANDIPVILVHGAVRRWEGFADAQRAAAKLVAAKVRMAIGDSSYSLGTPASVQLPVVAGTYAAYGLGDEVALRAITLTPAEIFGVADRLGSLDVGKAATLFVASGDILQATTAVERIWIEGRPIDVHDNHHDRLYRKYLRKYDGLPKEQ